MILALLIIISAAIKTKCSSSASVSSGSSVDRRILLEFKQHVDHDPQHFLVDWQDIDNGSYYDNSSAHDDVCSWHGVSCDESQRVSVLNLSYANLSGHLPSSTFSNLLLLLDHLKVLSLGNNKFHGNFTGISLIQGNYNKTQCGLQMLDLSSNSFSGEVPHILDRCSSLKSIDLSTNLFSGQIPSSLGALKVLRVLNLASNHLAGKLPLELADTCGTIQEMDLSNNSLSGSVPVEFSSCASMISLKLSRNNFSGEFPDILGGMQKLEVLRIDNNMFEGMVPSPNANNTQLLLFDASSNLFSDFPQDFCRSDSSLTALYLPNNKLTGPVPTSISNCTHLQILDLSFNAFIGSFPPRIFDQLLDLELLVIWYSGLRGLIPPEIQRCVKLKALVMSYNSLQGPLPPQLFNCKSLIWISLTGNQLNGTVPPEFSELKILTTLELGSNSFTGHVPWELENCTNLVHLDLSNNLLEGVIPARIGSTIYASFFNVTLPYTDILLLKKSDPHFCTGTGAEVIDVHGLRDEQLSHLPMLNPSCLYRLYPDRKGTINSKGLLYLDLSMNMLTGPIPQEIGSMHGLMTLDLRQNSLSGSIPSSLGQLQNLLTLDLAFNLLQGDIPTTLTTLTFLSEFNLSYNHLSGPIPSGGQFATFPPSAYSNNYNLCGLPLQECRVSSSAPKSNLTDYHSNIDAEELTLWNIILIFTGVSFFGTVLVWEVCSRVFGW